MSFFAGLLLGVLCTLAGQLIYARYWFKHRFKPDFDKIDWLQ